MLSKLLICEGIMSFPDALSPTYLSRIRNEADVWSIVEHFKRDELVNHDYSDCLGPKYTIPGLIASLRDEHQKSGNVNGISIEEICVALGYT
jgi:hypothetical protein